MLSAPSGPFRALLEKEESIYTDIFRYHLGLPQSYYRHELLKIPRKTDTSVPAGAFRKKFALVSESPVSEDEYIPSEDSD